MSWWYRQWQWPGYSLAQHLCCWYAICTCFFLYNVSNFLTDSVLNSPQFLSPTKSEIVVGKDEQTVTVQWNEVRDNCNGPVLQYILSVTPPTPNCQSGAGDCIFITNQTSLSVTLSINEEYSFKVHGVTCGNITGPDSVQGKTIICVVYKHLLFSSDQK